MHQLTLWYVSDPLLASGAFALAFVFAGSLAALCRKLGGTFAEAVAPSRNKLASLEGSVESWPFRSPFITAIAGISYTQTRVWTTGSSIIFARFASFGVLQFFFISGYLFWRKLIKKGGIELGRFYL